MLERLRSQAQFGLRATLQSLPTVRAISGWWEYSSEQQDASEYIGVVLDSASVLTRAWCSRNEEDGLIANTDFGQAVLLEMPARGVELQALVDEWQHQAHTHALTAQHAVVPIQIGRYHGGRKNQARLQFDEDTALPVFSHRGSDVCTRTTGQSPL